MTAYAKAAVGLLMLLLGFASGWWFGAGRMEGKWNASKASIAQAQDAASRKPKMKKLLLFVPLLLSACAVAPVSVQDLPARPKSQPPEAAMRPVPPAGHFVQTFKEILERP